MNASAIAVVTGATSGIGREFAVEYARRHHDLILVARREQELHALAEELQTSYGITATVRPCDLGDAAARAELVAELAGQAVDVLVNNAGYGDVGEFVAADPGKTSGMITLNCQALVELTHAVLPGMVQRRRGTVVNVASTAAFQPLPGMAVYAATKAFVLSFTQAVWSECRGSGVDVMAICPGPTETAFFDVAGAPDAMKQRRTPRQVVDTTMAGLKGHHSYVVDGLANNVLAQIAKRAPFRVVAPAARLMLRRG